MIRRGDWVKFKGNADLKVYEVKTDIYYLEGNKCVDLENYEGEVNVLFLEKVEVG